MSVFPAAVGNERRTIDLSTLEDRTRLLVQIGTDDRVVDGAGARALLGRLQKAGFPGENIDLDVVRSTIGFTSDHFAPMADAAAAQAAFWATRRQAARADPVARRAAFSAACGSSPAAGRATRSSRRGARHTADVGPCPRGGVQPDRARRRRAACSTCTRDPARWGSRRSPAAQRSAVFVDSDREACRTIERNLDKLRLTGAVVVCNDAAQALAADAGAGRHTT